MSVVYLSLHLTAMIKETTYERRQWEVNIKNTSDMELERRNNIKKLQCPSVGIETQIQGRRNFVYLIYLYNQVI
jgi:hypothetical protein